MAFVTLPSPIVWPGVTAQMAGTVPTIGSGDTLDGAGGPTSTGGNDAVAFVMSAPKAMAVNVVFFRCHAASSTPACKVRIETVGADGLPTGTLWPGSAEGASSSLVTAQQAVVLGATANLVAGDKFAIVFVWVSGTFNISTMAVASANPWSVPYKCVGTTGAAWVKGAGIGGISVGLGSSVTEPFVLPGFFPVNAAVTNNSFNNAAGGRRGARFRTPCECYVSGFRFMAGTALADFSAAIYDAAHAAIGGSLTNFDGDFSPGLAHGPQTWFFDTEVGPLSTGVDYYLGLMATSATTMNMYTFTLANADMRKAYQGGVEWEYAAGTPNMSPTSTQVPMLDLLISRIPQTDSGGDPIVVSGAHVIGM